MASVGEDRVNAGGGHRIAAASVGGSEIVEKRVEISTVVRRTTDGLGGESGGIHQVSAHCVGEVLVALLGCREYSGCVFGVS